MTWLQTLSETELVRMLGWIVIHSLWQGALIGWIMALLLGALRRQNASVRYLVACTGLGLIVLAPIATCVVADAALHRRVLAMMEGISVRSAQGGGLAGISPQIATVAAGLWFAGAVAFLTNMLIQWRSVRRMVRGGGTPDRTLQIETNRLRDLLGVRRPVELMVTTLAISPLVVGWLRPVVLLPLSATTGLSPTQLRMIIAHELAHVARADFLVNLVQVVIESLMFYHPVVWWLSHRIRVEREYCCDDLAVATGDDALQYARALATLEDLRAAPARVALPAIRGSLLQRIQRIVGQAEATPRRSSHPAGVLLLAMVLMLVAAASSFAMLSETSTVAPTPSIYDPAPNPDPSEYVPAPPAAIDDAPSTDTPIRVRTPLPAGAEPGERPETFFRTPGPGAGQPAPNGGQSLPRRRRSPAPGN